MLLSPENLVAEVGDGAKIPHPDGKDLTVNELIRMYLRACSEESEDNPKVLAHSTLVRYEDLRKNWIGPGMRTIRVRSLSEDDIDRVFAVMRKAGKSYCHMNQAKALLNGAALGQAAADDLAEPDGQLRTATLETHQTRGHPARDQRLDRVSERRE